MTVSTLYGVALSPLCNKVFVTYSLYIRRRAPTAVCLLVVVVTGEKALVSASLECELNKSGVCSLVYLAASVSVD